MKTFRLCNFFRLIRVRKEGILKKSVLSVGIILSVWGPCKSVLAATQTPEALFKQICIQCHTTNRILSRTKTKSRWKKTVDRMQNKLLAIDTEIWDEPTYIDEQAASRIVDHLFSQQGYKDASSGTTTAKKRRNALRGKFTPTKARTTSRRKRKFTPTKARTKSSHQEKFKSSKTSKAEERRRKFREKFKPTKARTVSPTARTVK